MICIFYSLNLYENLILQFWMHVFNYNYYTIFTVEWILLFESFKLNFKAFFFTLFSFHCFESGINKIKNGMCTQLQYTAIDAIFYFLQIFQIICFHMQT